MLPSHSWVRVYFAPEFRTPSSNGAHRNGKGTEFTKKYRVTRLVHIEPFADVRDAIAREKALKK
ncbi:hypothetical protein SPHINGOR109_30263 [Sphingorhabdus sp. 109]|nr:hypothetical protein SPHINGOR109_30263 [Sphingorhabdus sp. 109]